MGKSRRSRRGQAMRVMVLLGGLALAAALALPVSAAAGGASVIAGAPVLTNPALPAPPRVPKELVGPDPIYQRGRFDQDRPRDRDRPGRRPTTIVTVFPQPIFVAPHRCWYLSHLTCPC